MHILIGFLDNDLKMWQISNVDSPAQPSNIFYKTALVNLKLKLDKFKESVPLRRA